MGRCSCGDSRCNCVIKQGDNITVSGSGRPDDPYVITGPATGGGGGGGGASGFDSGDLKWTARATAPTGWLIANGQAVSRTAYAALFAALGTVYGAGDGSTTFNLPDYTGRFMLGSDGAHPAGSSGGSETRILDSSQMPAHTHTINHDHPAFSTSTDGNHIHTVQNTGAHDHPTASSVDDTGRDSAHFVRAGATGSATNNNLVQTAGNHIHGMGSAGAHAHNVDVPVFNGTSGQTGGSQPINIMPPYTTALPLIKT